MIAWALVISIFFPVHYKASSVIHDPFPHVITRKEIKAESECSKVISCFCSFHSQSSLIETCHEVKMRGREIMTLGVARKDKAS